MCFEIETGTIMSSRQLNGNNTVNSSNIQASHVLLTLMGSLWATKRIVIFVKAVFTSVCGY